MGLLDKLGLPPQPKAAKATAPLATKKATAPVAARASASAEPSLLDRAGQYGREALEQAKGYGRDKLLEGLGTVKGVATQVTEVADTAMWVGDEAKKLRDRAAEAVGGQKGTLRRQIVDGVVDGVGQGLTAVVPGMGSGNLGDAAKTARDLGLVDDKGKASITAPMTAKLNDAAKWVEKKVGGKPADPALLSAMELAELKASIGVQAGLALTGVEEVKIVMNIAGAAGALRGLVEAVRANPKNWHKDTAVWSGVIGVALGVLGLKNTLAAGKITTIALKYGWLAQAVPPLTRIGIDHFDTTLTAKQREERDKENFKAAMMVVKDAVLHVVESQGAKPPPAAEPTTAAKPVVAEPAAAPAAKPVAKPEPKPVAAPAAKPAAKPAPKALPKAPAKPAPVTLATVNKVTGMQGFLQRLDGKGMTLNELGLTPQKVVDLINENPGGAIKELHKRVDLREAVAEQQLGSAKEKVDAPHNATDPEPLWSRATTVGKNPSKDSPTGRAVIARMRQQKLVTGAPGQEMVFHKPSGKWYPIADCEMGHTHDAVTWWNNEGRFFGSKSPQVKAWMNDPAIYELEPGSINSSRGAQVGDNYKSPHPDPITPDEMKGIVKDRSKAPPQ